MSDNGLEKGNLGFADDVDMSSEASQDKLGKMNEETSLREDMNQINQH